MNSLSYKKDKLHNILRECGSVTVAFSSGVDSAFLLKTAFDVLGQNNVHAVTASSAFIPEREITESKEFCAYYGIRHSIINMDVLNVDGVKDNPKDRCYLCKKAIFERIIKAAAETVCEGSNADDVSDYRPGMKALSELKVRSPLMEAGLTKDEIRILSKEAGIPQWNKPSAACLASRCAYGERITLKKLKMVELAEEYLKDRGFINLRVRIHGSEHFIARIELPVSDIERFIPYREETYNYLKELGFTYITLDLHGFSSGSMNMVL